MECNKEEAGRAKEIAEQRLHNEDFAGAKKMALKAEQLFPQLDLTQILTVCEVHCSAQLKVNGQHDWYRILQVEHQSDENLIRRQYRKLALLLHPDKNKLPGAEAAFKLVGEANKILSDRHTRSIYDIKRDLVRPAGPQHSKNTDSSHNSSFGNFNSTNQPRPQQQQQPQPQTQPQPQQCFTFWTKCTNCKTHHQFYRSMLSKTVCCVECSRNFTAILSPPPNPEHTSSARNQPQQFSGEAQAQTSGVRGTTRHSTGGFRKPDSNLNSKPSVPNSSGLNSVTGQRRSKRVSADTSKSDANASSNHNANPSPETNPNSDANPRHDDREQTDSGPHAADTSTPRRSARFKRDVNSNNSEGGFSTPAKKARVEVKSKNNGQGVADTTNINTNVRNSVEKDLREKGNQKGKEKVEPSGLNVGQDAASRLAHVGTYPKCDVNSNNSDGGFSTPVKKARVEVKSKSNGHGSGDATNINTNVMNIVEKDLREKGNQKGKEKVEPSGLDFQYADSRPANVGTYPNSFTNTKTGAAASSVNSNTKFVYLDPEFCDFDKLKDVRKFAVNQIWALYDNLDAMPRFYGRIRDVSTESGFKVKYTWLEHKPVNEAEAEWSDEELPVGCGNYTLGKTEKTDDRLMFSHMVLDEKDKKKGGPYVILPRKGEVWAVFKDWDIKWSQQKKKKRKYEYEVVEVLSDFSRANGIRVVPLVKVEGFVSVFVRIQNWVPVHVPHGEMLRFSHSIPVFRLSGSERDHLPEGSLELDTVALPTNFTTAFRSVSINFLKPQTQCNERNDRDESAKPGGSDPLNGDNSETNNINESESPEPNVDALYEYPDTYFHNFDMYRKCDKFQRGQIWALYSDLDTYPKYYGYIRKVEPEPFKVHTSWLEADPRSEVEREWLNATFPVSCGKFKVSHQTMIFDNPDTFSHIVSTKHHRGVNYEILPEVGEIWALYKNWCAKWTPDDFGTCEFDLVEIKEQREESIIVWPLRRVTGYRTVFMPERVSEIGSVKREISADEHIIFSHRIPAIGLTEERGGKLRGFWELDPASVPDQFLYCDD